MPKHGSHKRASSSGSTASRSGAEEKRPASSSSSSESVAKQSEKSPKEETRRSSKRRSASKSSGGKKHRSTKEKDRGGSTKDRREKERSRSGKSRREKARSRSRRDRREKSRERREKSRDRREKSRDRREKSRDRREKSRGRREKSRDRREKSKSCKILRQKESSRSGRDRGDKARSRSRDRGQSRHSSPRKSDDKDRGRRRRSTSVEKAFEVVPKDTKTKKSKSKAPSTVREKEAEDKATERGEEPQEDPKKTADGADSDKPHENGAQNGVEAKLAGIDDAAAAKPTAKLDFKGLGDLAELQKGLERERSMLQLFILKAKQEHEEHKETKDKKAMREKEYFRAEFGEPCGPKDQLILEEELGRGVFSTVFRAKDIGHSGKEFAVKFIRSNPMLKKATEKEIRLMRRLRNEASIKDPEGARCFLGLAGPETFEYKGHLALVFHLQRCDMRTGLSKYGQGRGLPLFLVRSYAKDLFMALRALGAVNVIHSDVKPDNLLMSLDKASVRLSDFGSAMAVTERVRTDYLQPRFYRAPEVILGQSYTTQIDVWSAAATVFELATGRILFTGKTNNGMLHEMLKIVGAFSKRFATLGETTAKHFTKAGEFRCKESGEEQLLAASHFKKPLMPLSKLLADVASTPPAGVDAAVQKLLARHLCELLAQCLIPDPAERATPEQALEHKYFQKLG